MRYAGRMSETPFIVQKVDWYQLRDPSGHALLVMVASLPNGFVTATPCRVTMQLADHSLIALGATADDALTRLQANLAGRTADDLFPSS